MKELVRNKTYDLGLYGELKFLSIQEELKMGGPLVGEVYFNENNLDGFFSIPAIISEDGSKVVLSKFFKTYWKSFFKMILIDLKSQTTYESKFKSKFIFLDKIVGDKITFYNATHNELEEYKELVSFNLDNFQLAPTSRL